MEVGGSGLSGLHVLRAVTTGLKSEAGHVTNHCQDQMGQIVLERAQRTELAMNKSVRVCIIQCTKHRRDLN